jgi:hypothetical protein
MTKLEFLPEPYMIFRLRKLSLIWCLFCIEFSQALLIPYERFVLVFLNTIIKNMCLEMPVGIP